MQSDDLKKLLAELNLTHHEAALRQVAARPRQEFREELDQEQDSAALHKQIKAVNKILKKRSWGKRVTYAVLVVGAVAAISYMMQ